jgi:hypothetical protein
MQPQMQPGRCKLVDFQVIVDYFSAPSTAKNANDRSWYYQSKLLSSSISLIVVLSSHILYSYVCFTSQPARNLGFIKHVKATLTVHTQGGTTASTWTLRYVRKALE